MPLCTLHEVQVGGLPVEAGGEGMVHGADRERAGNLRLFERPGEVRLDLPAAQPLARLGPNQRHLRGCVGFRGWFPGGRWPTWRKLASKSVAGN